VHFPSFISARAIARPGRRKRPGAELGGRGGEGGGGGGGG